MASKKLTVVDYPACADLLKAAGKLSCIEVDKRLSFEVVAELDAELYYAIAKDPTWVQKLQDASMKKARAEIQRMGAILADADEQAKHMRKEAVDAMARKLQAKFDGLCKDVGDETERFAAKMIEDYKKADKSLRNFRFRTAARVGVTVLTVVPGIAITAVTAGALSPLAIMGAVKAAVSIVSEITKVFATADVAAKIVQKELEFLGKRLTEIIDVNGTAIVSNKSIGARSIREIGFNLASKAVSIPLPSLRNCEERIGVHRDAIQKLRRKSKELSETIYLAMDLQADWQKIFNGAKAKLPADKVGPIKTILDKKERELDALLKKTITVNEKVTRAETQNEGFVKALDAMKEGVPNWLSLVDASIAFTVDAGLGAGLAVDDVEKAVSVLNALAQTLAEEGIIDDKK